MDDKEPSCALAPSLGDGQECGEATDWLRGVALDLEEAQRGQMMSTSDGWASRHPHEYESAPGDELAPPNRRAMIMNVNEPETRGVALALHVVLDDLGKGVGPAIVAVLITALGRQLAFSLSILGWVPCGLLICACFYGFNP